VVRLIAGDTSTQRKQVDEFKRSTSWRFVLVLSCESFSYFFALRGRVCIKKISFDHAHGKADQVAALATDFQ